MSTTKFIGMKEFRQNLAQYTEEAMKKKSTFVVLKKNTPVLLVQAIDPKEFEIAVLRKELQEAKDEIDKGNYYTHDEVLKILNLEDAPATILPSSSPRPRKAR